MSLTPLQQKYLDENPAGNLAFGSALVSTSSFLLRAAVNGFFIYNIPARDDRRYLIIQNQSTTLSMFVAFNNVPSAVQGIQIFPTGNYEPLVVPTSSIYITATAAVQGAIVEG